jgi:small subunit ribosomal protein S6
LYAFLLQQARASATTRMIPPERLQRKEAPLRPYELMTILAPDVPEDELAPALDTIGGYLTDAGATIVHVNRESPWGRRRLAYSIRYAGRDVRDGFYTLWYFDAEPQTIVEIEREIRLNDRIIRHMVVALEKQYEVIIVEPSDEEGEEGAERAAPTASEETGEASAAGEPTAESTAEAEVPEATADPEASEAASEAEVPEATDEAAPEAEVPEVTAESIDAEVPTEAEDAAEE